MVGDRRVLTRLCEGRLVALVVSPAAVADEVHEDVSVEALAIGVGKSNRGQAGLGLVGVDMDDWDLEAFGEIAGIEGRPTVSGGRGEADLVIDDDVDCASGLI